MSSRNLLLSVHSSFTKMDAKFIIILIAFCFFDFSHGRRSRLVRSAEQLAALQRELHALKEHVENKPKHVIHVHVHDGHVESEGDDHHGDSTHDTGHQDDSHHDDTHHDDSHHDDTHHDDSHHDDTHHDDSHHDDTHHDDSHHDDTHHDDSHHDDNHQDESHHDNDHQENHNAENHVHIHMHLGGLACKDSHSDDHHDDDHHDDHHDDEHHDDEHHDDHHDDHHNETYHATCHIAPNSHLQHGDDVHGRINLIQHGNGPVTLDFALSGFDMTKLNAHTTHGYHIHEFGDLSNSCDSLGALYDHEDMTHSDSHHDDHKHASDLGNIENDSHGNVAHHMTDDLISLHGKYAIIGRSIVINEGENDEGAQIACCVIGRAAIEDEHHDDHSHDEHHDDHHNSTESHGR